MASFTCEVCTTACGIPAASNREVTACSMAAGELSLRPCFPLSSRSRDLSLLLPAGGDSGAVGVVAPGEVMAEEGEAIAAASFPPGDGQTWELEVGEAVLLALLLSLLRRSWSQWSVAKTAAPTVKAMMDVSDRLCGDILQAQADSVRLELLWMVEHL